ncbi:MAG: ribbon-helix-helix domain-containing protein [Solirubrobacterales bacterium]
MSHRTQITLTDEQYELLRREAKRSGLSMSELVRQALDLTLTDRADTQFEAALRESFGLWKDRDFDGKEYVEQIRGPGLGHRLARWR